MSRIRTVSKDIQSRAQHVAALINKLLSEIAEEAHAEGWDGRELFAGLGVALGQACVAYKISPSDAIRFVNSLDLPEQPGQHDIDMIVQPNGRPLAKLDSE